MRNTCSVVLAVAMASAPLEAQLPIGADTMRPAAVAESLKVMRSLTTQLKASPNDAALHYRVGRIAFAIGTRVGFRMPSRAPGRAAPRDSMPPVDRPALRFTASDGLSRAVELDATNVEYLITRAEFLAAGSTLAEQQLSRKLYQQAHDLLRADVQPERRAGLLLRLGQGAWYEYNKFRLDDKPMEGFRDELPSRTVDTPAEEPKRGPGSSPENHRPRPSATTAGATTQGTQTAAATNERNAGTLPAIGMTNSGIPDLVIGPRGVVEATRAELAANHPLPRILALATRRALERLTRLGEPALKAERHYLAARDYFDEAYAVLPVDARTWRAVSMLRVERSQWPALQQFANDRIRVQRDDAWGWFALGLARQRQQATADARAAFDSGLVRLTEDERTRLVSVARLLRPSTVPMYAQFDSASRAKYDAAAWLLADPLWSVDEEDPRIEFFARIAHAELMWGTLSPRRYGADTPDGQRFVRYGPPVKALNNMLLYPGGLIFAEGGERSMLRAMVAMDNAVVQRIHEWQPARWDNIAQIDIDSMPVQAARFRASGDSVDFFFAAHAPSAKLDSAPVHTTTFAKYWIMGWNTPDVVRDSISLPSSGALQWTRRLPLGLYNYRVEAIAPGTRSAARAAADIMLGADTTTGFTTIGFGMSDLLFAHAVNDNPTARRWRDVEFTPLTGNIAKGATISAIWENYEVGKRGDAAEYHVTMTLNREESFGGRMSMDIVSGVQTPLKRQSKVNQIIIEYDRAAPHAPVLVDNLTLSFGNTPAGAYYLTIAVTDKASGRTSSRTRRIVVE